MAAVFFLFLIFHCILRRYFDEDSFIVLSRFCAKTVYFLLYFESSAHDSFLICYLRYLIQYYFTTISHY